MRRNALALALLLIGMVAPRSAAVADGSTSDVDWRRPEVGAFLEALDRDDEAAMTRLVTAPDADPVTIAYGVWLARLDSPAGPESAARAARAVARLNTFGPSKAEFAALVETWVGYDEARRAQEREGAELAVKVAKVRAAKAHAAVRQAIDAVEGTLLSSTKSPAAVTLRTFRLTAIQSLSVDPAEVVREFDESLAAARALPWPERASDFLLGRSIFERKRGREAEGLKFLDQALELGAERLSPRRHAGLRSRRADSLSRLFRFEDAIAESRAAAAIYRGIGDVAEAAISLGTEARALRGLGRLAEAREAGERCRRESLAAGNVREGVRALVLLALLSNDAGRLPAGLAMLEQALVEVEPVKESEIQSHVLTNLGLTESQIGYFDSAVVHLARALAIRRSMHDVAGAISAGIRVAELRAAAGQKAEAERELKSLAEEASRLGMSHLKGLALKRVGFLRLVSGDFEAAITTSDEAVEAFDDAGSPTYYRTGSEACAAQALLRLGRTAEGLARARASVDRSAGTPEPRRTDARTTLALALVRSGDASAALAELRVVLDAQRATTAGIADADPADATRDVRRTTELGVRAALLLPAEDSLEAAFPFVEAGRAAILSSALVARDALLAARLPVALRTEERASRDAVNRAMDALARASRGRGSNGSGEVERARAALDEADRRRTAAIARVGRESLLAIELVDPPRATLAGLRALLRDGEAYLAFHVASDDFGRRLVALVVTRKGGSLVDLGDAVPTLEKASAWIDLVSAPGSKEETLAASLYDRLVRPLEAPLAGVDHWMISPDGDLSFLPWGALRRMDGESSTRLVERAELTLVPSASVLKFLREQPARGKGRGVLAVADPTPGPESEALPASREEIAAIEALHPAGARTGLVGDDATVEGLRSRLDASRGRLAVVHLATHGVFDRARPRMSGLVFAKGDRLFFDDVAALRVDADLAVLSGCETAKGALRPGEGVLGLVRAFFLAGCPRVVASSWRVSDASTRELMVRFHERMAKDGLAPCAALRASQIERWKAGGEGAHPYHWAAFQAWGLPE